MTSLLRKARCIYRTFRLYGKCPKIDLQQSICYRDIILSKQRKVRREGQYPFKLGFYRDSAVMTVHNLFVIAINAKTARKRARGFQRARIAKVCGMSQEQFPIPSSVTE